MNDDDLLADLRERAQESTWHGLTPHARVVYTLGQMLGGTFSPADLVTASSPNNIIRAVVLLDRAGALS